MLTLSTFLDLLPLVCWASPNTTRPPKQSRWSVEEQDAAGSTNCLQVAFHIPLTRSSSSSSARLFLCPPLIRHHFNFLFFFAFLAGPSQCSNLKICILICSLACFSSFLFFPFTNSFIWVCSMSSLSSLSIHHIKLLPVSKSFSPQQAAILHSKCSNIEASNAIFDSALNLVTLLKNCKKRNFLMHCKVQEQA